VNNTVTVLVLEDKLHDFEMIRDNIKDEFGRRGIGEPLIDWASELNTARFQISSYLEKNAPLLIVFDLHIDYSGPPQGSVDEYIAHMLLGSQAQMGRVQVVIFSIYRLSQFADSLKRYVNAHRSQVHIIDKNSSRPGPELRKALSACLNEMLEVSNDQAE
jgi:hypothetical protein